MRAEIIGVGTELLLGQIANTNAQKISDALARIGVDVYFHSAVGDNPARIGDAVEHALSRADAVVVTGGLGPTPDDITAAAIAKVLGRDLVRDERLASLIRSFFENRGRTFPEDNLKQADLPSGAIPIEPEGTAPGFYVEHEDRIVFALPGVPWEMQAMLTKTVVPVLRDRAGDAVTLSRQVLVVGLGESHTHEAIASIVDAQTNPTVAFLAGGGLVKVRLTAKAATEHEALGLIAPIEAEVRERLGVNALETGDGVAEALARVLLDRRVTVAVAESLTGGLVGAMISDAAGASEYFRGSLVAYATEVKTEVAGVDRTLLTGHGAVSEEAAGALARRASKIFGADLGLATTGVAGPTEQEGKPVGTIYVAAHLDGRTEVRFVQGYGDRGNIRSIAVNSVLDLGRRVLLRT